MEYITDEELAGMSEAEMEAWLKELADMEDEVAARMEKDGYVEPGITLKDIEDSYGSDEFREMLDMMETVDYPSLIFEDEEDVAAVNNAYKKVVSLKENASEKDKIKYYLPLYYALYPYIKRVNPFWGVGADRLRLWAGLQDEFRTVFTLTKEKAEAFRMLVSDEDFERIGEKNVYTLGSVRWAGGEKTAAGILMFTVFPAEDRFDEPKAKIDWLYVAEEFRGQHVADDLMAAMYDSLNGAGIEALTCDVPAVDILPMMVCDFLSTWNIFFNLEPLEEFSSTVGDLTSNPGLSGKVSGKNVIRSLKEMGMKSFSEEVSQILCINGDDKSLPGDAGKLEPELSLIAEGKGGDKACILVERSASGRLIIRRMISVAKNGAVLLDMLKTAVNKAADEYDKDTPVYTEIVSDGADKLLDFLFPEHGIPMYLVGVNLSALEDITSEIFEYLRYRYMQEKDANS